MPSMQKEGRLIPPMPLEKKHLDCRLVQVAALTAEVANLHREAIYKDEQIALLKKALEEVRIFVLFK